MQTAQLRRGRETGTHIESSRLMREEPARWLRGAPSAPRLPPGLGHGAPLSRWAQTGTWNCPVPGPACACRPWDGSATSGGPCRVPRPVAVMAVHGAVVLSGSGSSLWPTAPGRGRREATVPLTAEPAPHGTSPGSRRGQPLCPPPSAFRRNEVRGNPWGKFALGMREPRWGSQIQTPASPGHTRLAETPRRAPHLGVYGDRLRPEM